MTTYRYANRAKAQLSRALTARDTTLTLVPGSGALFPETPHDNDQFALTLTSVSTPEQYEICMVLHRNGDTLTLRRGQENTTPQAFVSGDIASLNMTAGLFSLFPQAGYMGVFDQDIANRLGGYRKNAIVCDPDTPGLLWVSTQDHNTTSPTADTNSPWLTLSAGGAYLSGTEGMVPGDMQGIGLHTRGGDNAVLYKDSSNNWRVLALGSDIDAERQARQAEDTTLHTTTAALEQNKVSRSGDTMSGNLTVQQTTNWGFGRGGGETILAMSDGPERFYRQLYRPANGPTQGILGVADESGNRQWTYQRDGSIVAPSGNALLEGEGSARTKVQAFRVTGSEGNPWITFPSSFSASPIVSAFVTREDNYGNGWNTSRGITLNIINNNAEAPNITPTGFSAQIYYLVGEGIGSTGQPWSLDVIAIGPF